jgi:plastocyanin
MQRRVWLSATLIVALIFATAACSSSSSTSSAVSSATTSSSGDTPANVKGKSTFDLSQNNFFFSPSTLSGTAGQKLTITVTNEGSVPHTFTIDSLNVDVTLNPGASQQVDVTFPQSGSVQFYCRFHKTQGMVGSLEVG